MKYLIIGGIAAGTKTAAKLKRLDRGAEVRILTKSGDISYAGCGLPYYIGGMIGTRDELIVNTPEKYTELTGAEVETRCEVTSVNTAAKTVSGIRASGEQFTEGYDKLVIAVGAEPFIPPVTGVELPGVFSVRKPDDAVAIRDYIEKNSCRRAVVCGAGFIGLEVAENLLAQGLRVTVIDAAGQIMPNAFDTDMAGYAENQLTAAGMRVFTGTSLTAISGGERAERVETSSGSYPADIVILSVGIRPATKFLEGSGVDMFKGTVVVDRHMQTNVADVYAVGDCAMVKNRITGAGQWSAMGSTANLTARTLAKALCGAGGVYGGCLGTGVVKLLPTLNAGRTGLTEAQALEAGYDAVSALSVVDDKAHYYSDAASFIVKLITDRASRKLLGIQVFGPGAVDKMTDIAVTGIAQNATLDDFDTLDFAYAPPFSTAIHPFVTACYVLENKLSGVMESFTPAEYESGAADGYTVIDIQQQPSITGARWLDLAALTGPVDGLSKSDKLLLVCTRGRRAYFAQTRLKAFGYNNTRVLEGGVTFNSVKVKRAGGKLPASEIKRVKGLGCLQDKRFDDVFNIRVITRNGKITSDEQRAVADAAEIYGSGEVTMTTRQTLEIQGVPYDNLDALMDYLSVAGLDTGGTGSKVRPVVACKGTTCQYGLIDSFDLSDKLHKLFYEDYHGVSLPHKFKIAVGGCPNNCVKPDLNDLGIIGQCVPHVDPSKCRDCAECHVESSCPIHIASVKDGKIKIDPSVCNNCGRCVDACPFGAVKEGQKGYKIVIGGRWGKKVAQGRALDRIFMSEDEAIAEVEKTILFYRDEGITGERFSDTIERLGFSYVEDRLLNGAIDKETVLKKEVKGGATC